MSAERLRSALSNINSIHRMLSQLTQEQWQQCLNVICRELRTLDDANFFGSHIYDALHNSVLFTLQRIAYPQGTDLGESPEIGAYCNEKWLRLLENDPQSVQVLQGK